MPERHPFRTKRRVPWSSGPVIPRRQAYLDSLPDKVKAMILRDRSMGFDPDSQC
jgi:hypothetical protein